MPPKTSPCMKMLALRRWARKKKVCLGAQSYYGHAFFVSPDGHFVVETRPQSHLEYKTPFTSFSFEDSCKEYFSRIGT